jgi:hypothetical protein
MGVMAAAWVAGVAQEAEDSGAEGSAVVAGGLVAVAPQGGGR